MQIARYVAMDGDQVTFTLPILLLPGGLTDLKLQLCASSIINCTLNNHVYVPQIGNRIILVSVWIYLHSNTPVEDQPQSPNANDDRTDITDNSRRPRTWQPKSVSKELWVHPPSHLQITFWYPILFVQFATVINLGRMRLTGIYIQITSLLYDRPYTDN